jgi:hypothetical protein
MIPREWIISHRCSWMVVYIFCCNAQSKSHSDPHDICTLSLFYQLPNYNLLTQHVITFTRTIYFLAYYYCLPLDTSILCLQQTGEIDKLIVSWEQVLGYVVCRFHVAASEEASTTHHFSGAIVWSVSKLASINLLKFGFLLLVR